MTVRRYAGECRRDDDVCASEVAGRIFEVAEVSAVDLGKMPAPDRRLLSRLVVRRAMPEVTTRGHGMPVAKSLYAAQRA